ncbi:BolA family protein [Fluviispira multicolorata]|uniref:BolA/IbaG family iron-sulfur metabolism protein n=1 Tax=Fluviispira multicolorata TaxID=2654512 RepID=A0A833JF79_9BACT|nr:BolA/IbaG family iron-sulfur metabolism protein [Fluviispira multicolorata]KAB8030910.1 BolA/IbaG family iron-sulfur metabolism protein [Fluviispira multicolorata]
MSIKLTIENKLKENFSPLYLKVENESYMHSVPKGSETHFRIEIVSNAFENISLLKRHRMINEVLAEEFSKIRASSLHTFTQSEWEKRNGEVNKSPNCMGGSKTI